MHCVLKFAAAVTRRKSIGQRAPLAAVLAGTAAVLTGLLTLQAAPPKIEYIEPFLSDMVLIHFYTEPNRAYILQYTERLTNGVSGSWSNLYSVPAFPFENHYIVPDWRTNAQRFYRLKVTP